MHGARTRKGPFSKFLGILLMILAVSWVPAQGDQSINTGLDGICQSQAHTLDVQTISVGKGKPNTVCITTGPDGVCNTGVNTNSDDVQVIPEGNGRPHEICVRAGADGMLVTQPDGDDSITQDQQSINTGLNGICNTTSQPTDVQVIAVNHGKSNAPAIYTGNDGICKTSKNQFSDDEQVIPVDQGQARQTCVTAGADRNLQSAAAFDDEVEGTPPDIPTLSEWALIVSTILMFVTVSIVAWLRRCA